MALPRSTSQGQPCSETDKDPGSDLLFDSCSSSSDLVEVKQNPTSPYTAIANERADGKHHNSWQIIPEYCETTLLDLTDAEDGRPRCAIEIVPTQFSRPEKSAERLDKKSRLQHHTEASSSNHDARRPVPELIRINSPLILKTLADIDSRVDAAAPTVMLQPFKFLVDYEGEIRECIQALTKEVHDAEAASTPDRPKEEIEMSTTANRRTDDVRQTLQHMQCLADFFDHYIKPTLVRLSGNTDPMIYFSDLWYMFQPGEDVFVPLKDSSGSISGDAIEATPETFQRRYNMLWRVTRVGGSRSDSSSPRRRSGSVTPRPFIVEAYYIDFDGKYFFPLVHTFSIMPFKGLRDANSLELLPVRLSRDSRKLQAHSERGKGTFDGITKRVTHFYYEGPTLVVQPCGCPLQSEPLAQEHIESEVIVDFRVTLLHNPSWRPKPDQCKISPLHEYERETEYSLGRRNEDDGSERFEGPDHGSSVLDDDFVDEEKAKTFNKTEKIFSPVPRGWESNESMVPEADPGLLCGRVFAFVLRTRTFAPLWVWLLQPIKPQTDGLNTLQLRDNTPKDIIHALVKTHFVRKIAQQHSKEYDVVRGKGKGLVILLHGAPGVGKTLTAESVAAASGRPLLQITCGDLGMTPGDVEKRLKEIFRYAQLWNCVLLLDECDIFLTQRTKTDIVRNSLVSTFLRVLEFHSGVLFLTTNRVGVLDDAIKSRITWSAYYPPLNWAQTKEIWKANIKLHRERNEALDIDETGALRFAREHFKSSSGHRPAWNGRQIQNAFKVATALAEWDAYSEEEQRQCGALKPPEDGAPSPCPRLLAHHFRKVAEGTSRFDDYMQEATGATEAERAFNAMERADDFNVPADHDSHHVYAYAHANTNTHIFADRHTRKSRPQGRSPVVAAAPPHWYSSGNPSPTGPGLVSPPSRPAALVHQPNHLLPHRQSNSSFSFTQQQNDADLAVPPSPQGRRRRSSGQMPTISPSPSMDSQFHIPRSPPPSGLGVNYGKSGPYFNDHGNGSSSSAPRPVLVGRAEHGSQANHAKAYTHTHEHTHSFPAPRHPVAPGEEDISDSDDEGPRAEHDALDGRSIDSDTADDDEGY